MKNKFKGFTLVEVLISSMLLIVCMVGIMDTFVIGSYFKKSSEESTTALFLAQDLMELSLKFSFSDIADIESFEGEMTSPYDGYKWQINVIEKSPTLKQIDVIVTTPSSRFSRTVKISALRTSSDEYL